jgi:NADPH-dependent 2,4-dienoyl-CoA reductase/sulfur reductase-like enzyme
MHLVAVGGSDAGISAALRARELDPRAEVTVVVADAYPNFSICGIPYYVSGEVTHWRNLAHRTIADLEATGMRLRLDTTARRIDPGSRKLLITSLAGAEELISYDELVIGTGATPVRPPIDGLSGPGALGAADGVHLLHSMSDTFAVMRTLTTTSPSTALIVGAGYIGLEMADALTTRGLAVTQMEQLPEVLPTVDPQLGHLVRAQLAGHGVEVLTGTTVTRIARASADGPARLRVEARTATGQGITRPADIVLVVVGVRPDADLAAGAGAILGARGAIAVDRQMRTSLPGVYAAGDCVVTYHRLLGETYLPLGTTATSRAALPARTRSAAPASSPAASAPRSSRSSTTPRPGPACAITKPGQQASIRSPWNPGPTTTRRTTPAATASPCGSPATGPPAGSSASSSSATGTPRSPSASTSPPPPSSTK